MGESVIPRKSLQLAFQQIKNSGRSFRFTFGHTASFLTSGATSGPFAYQHMGLFRIFSSGWPEFKLFPYSDEFLKTSLELVRKNLASNDFVHAAIGQFRQIV